RPCIGGRGARSCLYDPGRERPDDRRGGSGLGLAIVKHVAEVHGGRVEVWSEPGRGSRFEVWLPALAAGR
ncbi:MAG: HAMP domain-containing histidine kinase, partial [Clostridia bacterium]|nr:HAMP domain-containing histidine kinase [Clostridia bacterium]